MTTEEMIDRMIDDDILTIKSAMMHGDTEYLYNILGDGIGYNNMTTVQIEIEYNDRTWEREAV
jgi:hypothetical protein